MRFFSSIIIILVILVLLTNNLVCISSTGEEDIVAVTGSEKYYLTTKEKEDLLIKARMGDGNAAFKLANYYEFIDSNRSEALIWLEKAAKNGHIVAQYNLAYFLSLSPDKKENEQAIYWFTQAANSGDVKAMVRLAQEYESGNILEGDLIKAKEWYQKAAFEKETSAIIKLIQFLYEGKGGSQDIVQAYAWILIAETVIPSSSVNGQIIANMKTELKGKLTKHDLQLADDEFKRLSLILNKK